MGSSIMLITWRISSIFQRGIVIVYFFTTVWDRGAYQTHRHFNVWYKIHMEDFVTPYLVMYV